MSTILPMGTPNPWLDKFKGKVKKGFGGGTKQGGINAPGYGGRIGMDPDSSVTMDFIDRDGDGVDDRSQRAPGTPYVGWEDSKSSDRTKFGRGGPGRGGKTAKRVRGRDGRGVDTFNPFEPPAEKEGWLDFYNKQRGGFTFDGNWKGEGEAPENAIFSVASNPSQGQRIDDGEMKKEDARKFFPQLFGTDGNWTGSGFGGTTTQGGTKKKAADKQVPSDFGQYNPATFGGNLYNQGWGNMVNWGNKFKDNKAIQGFISGARLDANQTMMNMGMDLLYQKGQMSQMADYHGGMENLKTGNTLKLLAAEGGITRDLMWDQGDILSRQIGERGDQDRRTLRATGQENRALVMTQGDQDRRGMRVEGQEQRAGIMTQGKEDRKGLRVKGQEDRLGMRVSGEEDRLGMRVSGEEERLGMRVSGEEDRAGMRTRGREDRMTIGSQGMQDRLLTKTKGREDRLGKREQGLQDRMLTQERGSEERKTQRDRYREDRAMRADARGAIRRSGSRFFG